jgi:hypothetical protein
MWLSAPVPLDSQTVIQLSPCHKKMQLALEEQIMRISLLLLSRCIVGDYFSIIGVQETHPKCGIRKELKRLNRLMIF